MGAAPLLQACESYHGLWLDAQRKLRAAVLV